MCKRLRCCNYTGSRFKGSRYSSMIECVFLPDNTRFRELFLGFLTSHTTTHILLIQSAEARRPLDIMPCTSPVKMSMVPLKRLLKMSGSICVHSFVVVGISGGFFFLEIRRNHCKDTYWNLPLKLKKTNCLDSVQIPAC